jgi:predicted CXXCH cytochrome family protein
MRHCRHQIALGVAFALVVLVPLAQIHASSCIDCHKTLAADEGGDVVKHIADDIHIQRGLSCESCHGGNPLAGFAEQDMSLAHDAAKGFVGAPTTAEVPDFCARCHGDVEMMKQYNPKLRVDQLLEYKSSQHGKKLAQGDTKVATCVSCHGVHGILAVSDTRAPVYKTNVAATCGHCHSDAKYMASYGIPTNQETLYRASVHGMKVASGDLSAPTCNNCHGNHGATPPGLTSIANACGECHANNRDFFNQSPHKAAFAETGSADCITCHNHHDIAKTNDAMLGVGEGSFCVTCHSEGDAGYKAAALMSSRLDSLKSALTLAQTILDRASQGGIDVKLGKFDLHAADDALIKARTAVHYFDTTKFNDITLTGVSDAGRVIELGNAALYDLRLRRIGLGFTLPLVLLVALAIYLHIRRIERERPNA